MNEGAHTRNGHQCLDASEMSGASTHRAMLDARRQYCSSGEVANVNVMSDVMSDAMSIGRAAAIVGGWWWGLSIAARGEFPLPL